MIMDNRFLVARRRYDPDATRYINAVQLADGQALEPEVAMAVDAFVKGCKADGIWDAIQASCIMCGARTLSGALVPLKTPYGSELVDINSLPTPTIQNDGTPTNGAWDAATRTMSNTNVGGNGYPRFIFAFGGITAGRRYRVTGRLSGDINKIFLLGLGNGTISGGPGGGYNATTGVFDIVVTAALSDFRVYPRGDLSPLSIRIESLSIREDSFTPTAFGSWASGDYSRSGATPGLKGDGTTKYLNTNRANNADGQNDQHMAVHVTAPPTGATVAYAGNGDGGSNGSGFGVWGGAPTHFSRSMSPTLSGAAASFSATGTVGISRDAASSYTHMVAGTEYPVAGIVSATPASDTSFVFARNVGGSATILSNARLAFYSVGSSLSLSALDARVTTLVSQIAAAIP